jgi:hypothetical protein
VFRIIQRRNKNVTNINLVKISLMKTLCSFVEVETQFSNKRVKIHFLQSTVLCFLDVQGSNLGSDTTHSRVFAIFLSQLTKSWEDTLK